MSFKSLLESARKEREKRMIALKIEIEKIYLEKERYEQALRTDFESLQPEDLEKMIALTARVEDICSENEALLKADQLDDLYIKTEDEIDSIINGEDSDFPE